MPIYYNTKLRFLPPPPPPQLAASSFAVASISPAPAPAAPPPPLLLLSLLCCYSPPFASPCFFFSCFPISTSQFLLPISYLYVAVFASFFFIYLRPCNQTSKENEKRKGKGRKFCKVHSTRSPKTTGFLVLRTTEPTIFGS